MVVKRYSNRRLYDTDSSRYVTLDEVAARIRAGEDVRFVDAPTGDDITQTFLAQIILEGRGAAKLLPVPLLYRLVRMGDDALAEFFGRYVTWALDVYLKMKQGARVNPLMAMPMAASEALMRWLGAAAPSPRDSWRGAAYVSSPQRAYSPYPDAPYPPPPIPEPDADAWPAPPEVDPEGAAGSPTGTSGRSSSDARQDEELAALRAELEGLKRALRDSLGRKD